MFTFLHQILRRTQVFLYVMIFSIDYKLLLKINRWQQHDHNYTTQNTEALHSSWLSHLSQAGDHNTFLCMCVYECVSACINTIHCVSDQCSNKPKKLIPKTTSQCRNSTSFSCLALWFLSLYSASEAGVSGTFRPALLSLTLPTSTFKLILLSTSADASSRSLSQVLLLTGICGEEERGAQVRTRCINKHAVA